MTPLIPPQLQTPPSKLQTRFPPHSYQTFTNLALIPCKTPKPGLDFKGQSGELGESVSERIDIVMMKRVICLAALSAMLLGNALAADYLHYKEPGRGTTGKLMSILANGHADRNVFAGQLKVGWGATGAAAQAAPSFITFCISPDKDLPPTNPNENPWEIATMGSYTVTGGMSLLERIGRLVAWGSANNMFDVNLSNTPANNEAAASFQVALWMVATGGPQSGYQGGQIASGTGSATDLVANIANNVTYGVGSSMAIYYPTNTNGQILVGQLGDTTGTYTPVPEPFTMGLGLAAAGAFIRRRVKAKKVA